MSKQYYVYFLFKCSSKKLNYKNQSIAVKASSYETAIEKLHNAYGNDSFESIKCIADYTPESYKSHIAIKNTMKFMNEITLE